MAGSSITSILRSAGAKGFVVGFGVFLFGTLLEAWLPGHNVRGFFCSGGQRWYRCGCGHGRFTLRATPRAGD